MTGIIIIAAVVAAVAAVAALVAVARRPREGSGELRGLLEAQGARLDRLSDTMGRQVADERVLREGLDRTRDVVERVRMQAEERRRAEDATREVIRRMETMLLGGSSRGRAGENVLQEALSCMPAGMVVRDFPVNGRRVEFALVLPNGKHLPVDSKWAAVREVEALEAADDPADRTGLARRVEDEVARRAREVASYLEPSITTPFAIACIPDAAYLACKRAHGEAFRSGVILVPYASALPVLLSLYSLAGRYGEGEDVAACLAELEGLLGAMEQTLENKLARATTMLQNAADEWRTHLGRARGSVARGRGLGTGAPPALEAVE